ncbi:MAG: DNA primase [Halocynthiibacter sp.]|jgi:DNA primase
MSLPPGFLDELRTRTSLSAVVGRKVMWDARKSNQGKGDMWAPCPFHQEKSASFHVDDRKGFYYCFGCGAKGDAISFIRETENTSFMEAIEILAREAGMPIPERDPKAQEKADYRSQIVEVMEAAVQHFRLALKTGAGSGARDYLLSRGLDEAAQARFDIGFAPDARNGLLQALTAKGFSEDLIVASGMCARPDDGGAPYDRFRGRITFPIRDPRGRCISMGGRAMDPNARAKYLNGPETELFDKGRSLYNHGPAREAAGKGQTLVVAEGYMDVIALAEAGFGATVAPLGTAITEDQLRLMWRIHPEPVIAMDGDKAGIRAAMRLVDIALPLLEAGQSLRFAIMPEGQDPDDILKSQGSEAMKALIEGAQPMVSLLWQRETEGRVFDSPERKAALDKSLREAIKKIADPSIRSHYGEEIKDLRWQLFRGNRGAGGGNNSGAGGGFSPQGNRPAWRPRGAPEPASPSAKLSPLAGANDTGIEDRLREAVILAACIATPQIIERFESALEMIQLSIPEHNMIRNAILASFNGPEEGFSERVAQICGEDALVKLHSLSHVRIAPPVRNPGNVDIAEMCVAEELAKLETRRGAIREISEAMADIPNLSEEDEGLAWRLGQAAQARNKATRSENEDKAEYDMAPNGARLNRLERNALADLLSKISTGAASETNENDP